jgi:hypothetical protein
MTYIIAKSISLLISLIAAVVLLRFYFNPNSHNLHKKKWVLVLCIILLVYVVVRAYGLAIYYLDEYKTSRESGLATEDIIIETFDAYKILIPAGYEYQSNYDSPYSLILNRQEPDILFKIYKSSQSLSSLNSIAKGLFDHLKSKNKTYSQKSKLNLSIDGKSAFKMSLEFEEDNNRVKNILYFVKTRDNYVYILNYVCLAEDYKKKETRMDLRKIIKSWQFSL